MRTFYPAYLLGICLILSPTHGAAGESVPKHLAAARELVEHLKLADTSYRHGKIDVQWRAGERTKSGVCHTDCSGFLDALLKHSYGLDDKKLASWLGAKRPQATHYHQAIVAKNHFEHIESVKSARAGDIIAVNYQPGEKNTGHVMLISARPRQKGEHDGMLQWEVEIIDCSMSGHGPMDTRHKKKDGKDHDGLGRGTLRLYTNADGQVTGYSWSFGPKSRFVSQRNHHVVIGRLRSAGLR